MRTFTLIANLLLLSFCLWTSSVSAAPKRDSHKPSDEKEKNNDNKNKDKGNNGGGNDKTSGGFDMECAAGLVLHMSNMDNEVVNTLCGGTEVCRKQTTCTTAPSAGGCPGTNQFLAGLHGSTSSCCDLTDVPEELQSWSCSAATVAYGVPKEVGMDGKRIGNSAEKNPDHKGHLQPSGIQPNLFVKSITTEGNVTTVQYCQPVCKTTTTTTTTRTTTTKTPKQEHNNEDASSASAASAAAASGSAASTGTGSTGTGSSGTGSTGTGSTGTGSTGSGSTGTGSTGDSTSGSTGSTNTGSTSTGSSNTGSTATSTSDASSTSTSSASSTSDASSTSTATSSSQSTATSDSTSSTDTQTQAGEESTAAKGSSETTNAEEETSQAGKGSNEHGSQQGSHGSGENNKQHGSQEKQDEGKKHGSDEHNQQKQQKQSSQQNKDNQKNKNDQQKKDQQKQQNQQHGSDEQSNVQSDNDASPHDGKGGNGNGNGGGGGGGGGGCFSGDTMVRTTRGPVRIDELLLGDEVLTAVDGEGPLATAYSPVSWFIHRLPEEKFNFVTITTVENRTLSLTPDHLIPLLSCDQSLLMAQSVMRESRAAARAEPGMCLLEVEDGRVSLVPIRSVRREQRSGIYAPVTVRGNIVVNNILASCYSGFESHGVQVAVFKMIEKITLASNYVTSLLSKSFSYYDMIHSSDGEIPQVLRFLLEAGNVLSHTF